MPSFALVAIGRDRPGIVAAVSKVLLEQECNVEDSSMTLLRGNFSMMLIVAAPDATTASSLEAALSSACQDMGLTYAVLDVEDTAEVPHASHVLTVYGADRPGILYRVTEELARSGVNITDVNSRLVGADTPVYALMLELSLPGGLPASELERRLHATATEIGVDLTLRAREEDLL